MPKHSDFERIHKQFIMRHGSGGGERRYYSWLSRLRLDETKPYSEQVKEAFRWTNYRGDEYYYCLAAFPLESMNKNIYSEEELIRAARTLIGKPVNLNHDEPLSGVEIVDAEYEDGAVECVLKVTNDTVKRMIDSGEITHVSIEAGFRSAELVDGVKPKGLVFTGLALLTKNVPPGIPLTRIYKSTEHILEDSKSLEIMEVKGGVDPNNLEKCYLCGEPLDPLGGTTSLGEFQMHRQCAQRFWRMATKIFRFSEGAVAPHDGPKAPEEREWDADAAEQRIRRWASSDGSGDKDKIDWDKYRQAFAWYYEREPENFSSYKLPHHDIIDGELCVVWRGVAAAMQALHGARGGVDIPSEDRRAVYLHLARHYAQFNKEPPPFEALSLPALYETIEVQRNTIQKLLAEKKSLEERLKAAKRQCRIVLKL